MNKYIVEFDLIGYGEKHGFDPDIHVKLMEWLNSEQKHILYITKNDFSPFLKVIELKDGSKIELKFKDLKPENE